MLTRPSHIAALLFLLAAHAHALDLWEDETGERRLTLDTRLKWSALASHAPDDPVLFADRWSGAGSLRARFEMKAEFGDFSNIEIAYEQVARWLSARGGLAIGPDAGRVPYRFTPLEWSVLAGGEGAWRHGFDRLSIAFHPTWGEITLGRQAVGLGRAWLFGSVDVFAPFAASEFDREWRPGVDAARISYRVSDTSSVELIGIAGRSWKDSAVLGRFRGYAGEMDWEVIAGKRAEDFLWATVFSGSVGDAEMHLELAWFHTPRPHPDGGVFGNDYLMAKATLGASYTFSVGNGLTLLGEYHYSSFGVADIADATERLADPEFATRLLRGDMQILGRHGVALQLSYPFNDMVTGSMTLLVNPVDGSGLALLSAGWDLSDESRLTVSCHLPWGDDPTAGRLESEYGANPLSLFIQLSWTF